MSDLTVRGLTARYNGQPVLADIDLEVRSGEWLAVIGPNGAGKTTLLRAISGIVRAGGEIVIDGHRRDGLSPREFARVVAVVPQAPTIPEAMTVLDYVLLGRTPFIGYWSLETAHDVAVARDLIGRLDLATMEERPIGTLSGGERQRAILARALAQEPGILLLDEPTAALDLGHQQQVLDLVDEMRHERGIAVVSAVHDLTLAAQYADRLMLLVAGVVAAEGQPDHVLTTETLTRHYQAAVTILRGHRGQLVVAPYRRGRADGDGTLSRR